jgi:Uma2 family endonuclease
MATLLLDPELQERVRAEREAVGSDRWDEVWEGVYVMPPMPNNEHQQVTSRVGVIVGMVIDLPGQGEVNIGANVSDREEGWQHNYRIPDIAVFLRGTRARNCGTHWCGGPDFLTEVLSPGDQTREKLPFYERLGVREALLIDRDPWALELDQLNQGRLALAGRSTLEQPDKLVSEVLPLSFRLLPGQPRPRIEISHRDGVQRWEV